MAPTPSNLTTEGKRQRVNLSDAEEQARENLDLLARLSGRADIDLGPATGFTRQTFYNRRQGFARIRRGEEVQLAGGLGVEPECFSMNRATLMAWLSATEKGRALLDGASDQAIHRNNSSAQDRAQCQFSEKCGTESAA